MTESSNIPGNYCDPPSDWSASWKKAVAARDESGGIEALTDEEILNAQKQLANTEGVFCEPASEASFGGFLRKAGRGVVRQVISLSVL